MSNVELIYLYRDGGDYKKWGKVIFSNPDGMNTESVERELRQAFLEDGMFIAGQIRIPEVFLYAGGKFSSDDHCYHEFNGVCPTTSRANDRHQRSMSEFLVEVTREAGRGWQVFDPYDSEGSYGFLLSSRIP